MELKELKKQVKMIYSMAKSCFTRREIKKIKKIHAKVFKKSDSSRRNSFSSSSDSYLNIESRRDERIYPNEHKETNKLDNAVNNKTRNKNQ